MAIFNRRFAHSKQHQDPNTLGDLTSGIGIQYSASFHVFGGKFSLGLAACQQSPFCSGHLPFQFGMIMSWHLSAPCLRNSNVQTTTQKTTVPENKHRPPSEEADCPSWTCFSWGSVWFFLAVTIQRSSMYGMFYPSVMGNWVHWGSPICTLFSIHFSKTTSHNGYMNMYDIYI